MKKISLAILSVLFFSLTSCSKSTTSNNTIVKPRYHHTWYKDHTYKKKWRVGRIKIEPEKQGVKRVKMKG